MKVPFNVLTAAALALGTASFAAPADAAPITAPSSLQTAAAPPVETVAWRGGWRGRGWGPAAVAGAIVGGAIAAAQPWNWGYGYYPSYDAYAYYPGYGYGYGYDYAPGYAYSPGYTGYAYSPGYTTGYSGGSDDAYCSQRFRSYDPASGTYMGYDGRRHSCP
jgi:BA14K-like protein